MKTYKAGINLYIRFCTKYSIVPLPLSESVLCKFVTSLADHPLQHRSIKTYLSGLRYFQIKEGQGDPFQSHMPWLHYVLRGVKRVQAQSGSSARVRLPITPDSLRKLKGVWSRLASDPDSKLI